MPQPNDRKPRSTSWRGNPPLPEEHLTYRAAWWLPGPHLPTLWAALARPAPAVQVEARRLELPDGDFVDLALTPGCFDREGPLVVLLHGLEGSLRSPYATRLFRAVEACGWAACLMHFRGCSGVPNRLARSYHSGDTADLAFLLRWLEKQAPHRALAAVGFSMGGNVLLKYLGENPGTSGLRCATAVSVPFDLAAAAARLDQGFSRVYQAHLLHRLHHRMRDKLQRHSNLPFSRRELARARTFHDYDDKITAPLHGFESAADYYAKASSARFVSHLLEPTLILHARDDPFLPSEAVPNAAHCGPGVVLEVPAHGGHLGFVTDPLPGLQRPWLETRIVTFLHEHLAHLADTREP